MVKRRKKAGRKNDALPNDEIEEKFMYQNKKRGKLYGLSQKIIWLQVNEKNTF